ncbi:MAG: carboxypeptidase regulatory-like domain-containing protein [Terriglobales bacterium]
MRIQGFFKCLWALLVVVSLTAHAQQPTGSIVGTVVDSTGAVVPAAKVTAREAGTGFSRTTTTNPSGQYTFTLLRPTTYEIMAEAAGFSRLVEHGIELNASQVVTVKLILQVGTQQETVEVTGETPLVQPDTTAVSHTIDARAIRNLPLLNRGFLGLALLTPGTIPSAPGSQVGAFTIAGMRSQSNNYTLDGISANDPQVNGPLNSFNISDAIQEFSVQTSIATTDVGRNSGAQVNIVTKSGSNAVHGSAFYSGRNDALDAAPFFLKRGFLQAKASGTPDNLLPPLKPTLRRHQYGGTVGGPVLRNRTFFFLSFEGLKQNDPDPQQSRVPTLVERAAVVDPVSQRLLQFWPEPNIPMTSGVNWVGVANETQKSETYMARIDHNLATNQTLMARYNFVRNRRLSNQTDPFNGNINNNAGQDNAVLQHTYSRTHFVNELRLGYSRNKTFFTAADNSINPAEIFTDAGGNPLPGFVDIRTDPRGNLNGGLPRITITGLTGVANSGFTNAGLGAGTNMPQGRATNSYELINNVTWIRNNHTFRFGFHGRYEITNRFLNGNFRGSIEFRSWSHFAGRTSIPLSPESGTCGACADGLARARRGTLRTGRDASQTFRNWYRVPLYFYFQDTYKPTANLTLNYGLRYEYPNVFVEKESRGSNFVPGVGIMLLGTNMRLDIDPVALGRNALILTEVDSFLPRSGQFGADKNNLAPYFALSWAPRRGPKWLADGKTVIRTGFRMGYDDVFNNIPVNMGLNTPFVLTTTLPSSNYRWNVVLNQNRRLFASDPTVPGGQRGIVTFNAWSTDPDTAYAMNYALEIERQIGDSYAVELSYLGSQGRKLGLFLDPNQPFITQIGDPTITGEEACATGSPVGGICPNGRPANVRQFPFPQYDGIFVGDMASTSNYHGLVATVKKRTKGGLAFQASYTYGRSLDANSSFFGTNRDFGFPADSRNVQADYGPSEFDVSHRFTGFWVYELPFGRGRKWGSGAGGFLHHLIGGWTYSGTFDWRSGFPFTVWGDDSSDFSGLNQFADRVNFVSGTTALPTNMDDPDNAFDGSVFTTTTIGDIGSVSRNKFRGPGFISTDMGLAKSFAIREGMSFRFRVDFFNAFNHTNFNLPVSETVSSSFGKIISEADAGLPARVIQLGGRIEF